MSSHDQAQPHEASGSSSRSTGSSTSGSSRSKFLSRLSKGSSHKFLSLASLKTALPNYGHIDPAGNRHDDSWTLDSPASNYSASPTVETTSVWDRYRPGSDATTTSDADHSTWASSPVSPATTQLPSGNELDLPPRYSLINPRNSVILPWIPSSTSAAPGPSDSQAVAGPSHSDMWNSSEFRYSFPIKGNKPWATLQLRTRDITIPEKPLINQPKYPRIWGCDPIAGVLQMEFDSPQTIQQITILLSGKIATSSFDGGSLSFLRHEFTIWKKSYGDPSQYTSTNVDTSSPRWKFDGKLMGNYSFPFSFPFPTHVDPLTNSAVLSSPKKSPRRLFDLIPESRGDHSRTNSSDYDMPTSLPQAASSSRSRPTTPISPRDNRNFNRQRSLTSASTSSYSRTILSGNAGQRQLPEPRLGALHPQEDHPSPDNEEISLASPMPPSFLEREVTCEISYELSAVIHRGLFKKKIKTNISYLPATQPLPASQKRRQAYATGALIPAPMNDPEGWLAFPAASTIGEFAFDGKGQRYAEVKCTLYLAQPLSYTRGTVLPCFLTFSSDDIQLLDHLAKPKVPIVRLMRRIRHYTSERQAITVEALPLGVSAYASTPLSTLPTSGGSGRVAFNDKDLKTVLHEVNKAVWWVPPANEVPQEPYVRHLDGEIHLGEDLQPSCGCKIFHIEYFVDMLPLYSAEFRPDPRPEKARNNPQVLCSASVEITTLCRQDEPVPIPFSEPGRQNLKRISDFFDE